MAAPMFEVTVERNFAAGHALRDYHGRREDIHGHNYKVQVLLSGPALDSSGLLCDFAVVSRLLDSVIARFDHKFINEIPPFDELNPSAENLARYFYQEMALQFRETSPPVPVSIGAVKIWETDSTAAAYRE